MRRRDDDLDARAWLLWYLAVSLPALLGRNPWPLIAALLAVIGVRVAWAHRMTGSRSWSFFVRIAIVFAFIGIVFNVLTVRAGDRVLMALPGALPLIGGDLTVNAVIFGILGGLALVLLVMAGSTMVSLVDWTDVVRIMPPGLTTLAVAGSVAFAFIPQTAVAFREIREAQVARGHQLRGARDLLPIVVPIMSGGLERAVTLSESLESRGFGGPAAIGKSSPAWTRYCLAGGLACGALAAFTIATGQISIALPALMAMVILLIPAIRSGASHQVRRTRYRATRWTGKENAVAIASAIAIAVTLVVLQVNSSGIRYEPYPRLTMPRVDLILVVAILGLITPALLAPPLEANEEPR
jgi:energy-coupling factor transport system permease protein